MSLSTNNNLDLPSSSSQPPPFDKHHHDHQMIMMVMGATTGDPYCASTVMSMKKLKKRASERERRVKINHLFTNLRSLLPCHYYDPTKPLGMPQIVDGALKYIPELQNEVNELVNKKQELLSKMSSLERCKDDCLYEEMNNEKRRNGKRKGNNDVINSWFSICINKLDETQIVIQILTSNKIPLPKILLHLEINRFLVVHVSSFHSFEARVFYNIYASLSQEGTPMIEQKMLNDQLESLIVKYRYEDIFTLLQDELRA